MAAVGISVNLRSYKSYFILILIPYLFLIFMFHTQLQLYDSESLRAVKLDVGGGLDRSDFAAQSYHVRSLRIKNASVPEETYQIQGQRFASHRRFGQQINVSHDVVVQGKQVIYYREAERDDQQAHHKGHVRLNQEMDSRDSKGQVRSAQKITADKRGPGLKASSRGGGGAGQQKRITLGQSPPFIGMNASEMVQSLMMQAGMQSNKEGLYFQAQWPHCARHNQLEDESIEYRLSLHEAHHASPTPPRIPFLPKIETLPFQTLMGHYFYTAFYDEREPESAYLRLIVLLKKGVRPALFCHFLSSNTPGHVHPAKPDKVYTSMLTYYEMCENHAKDYGGWILTCEVPSTLEPSPCEVTVSLHSVYNPKQSGNIRIPIMLLKNPAVQKADFGICVPPLFGYIPSTTLIEFVELTKILGAQHFMFYAHQIPREIQKVLRYYERIGVATVIPWDLPVKDKAIWYHGQLLAINDCLYRSMHKFNYVAFNDIDEFIVPHKHSNWSDMMRYIETTLTRTGIDYSGYSFQSAFFDPLLESSSRVLYDLESDLRTKSFSKVRTKVMTRVDRIHELGIHHISKPLVDTYKTLYIEPEVAFLHHYRKCVTDFDPRMNCQVFARDESLSRYIPTLRHNVHQTMWILKEAEKDGRGLDFFPRRGQT